MFRRLSSAFILAALCIAFLCSARPLRVYAEVQGPPETGNTAIQKTEGTLEQNAQAIRELTPKAPKNKDQSDSTKKTSIIIYSSIGVLIAVFYLGKAVGKRKT